MKFGRTYKMLVEGQYFTWNPAYPTSLYFDVQRSVFASANKGTFTLYNLQFAARRDIYFDRFVNDQQKRITLNAGYVGSPTLPLIFQGDCRVAWTERRGVDWITQLEAFDGGFAFYNAQAAPLALDKGYTMDTAASALVARMAPFGVALGKVSKIALPNSGGVSFVGNAWDELKRLVPGDGQLFIDNGLVNILNPQDYIVTPTIPIISPETGLIGTPRRQGTLTSVRMMFDPQWKVGQLANLQSLEPWLNSPRLKVVGIHHYGMISPVQNGDLYTELQLFSAYPGQQLAAAGVATEAQIA